jgi:hypothetical protein
VHSVHDAVLQFIGDPSDAFDALALAVFAHQYDTIEPYRRYCQRLGKTPELVLTWRDVPAVPVVAFKETDFACAPATRIFLTTGTSRGADQRGRHKVPDLRLYRASAIAGMRRFLLPDVESMRIISLIPPTAEAPESSLAQMVAWAIEELGTPDSRYATAASGIDFEVCVAVLRDSEQTGVLLCLMATTAALLHLIDYCDRQRLAFRLPHGARIMDTGGSKGALRPLSRKGLLQACWNTFAVPGYFCVNEYGMAELSSQFYENVIATRTAGQFTHRHLVGPPWARVRVLDPATLADAPAGERGLACLYDLANAGTAMAVLTEDIGRLVGDGFVIEGRAHGAETRGCSLAAAEWAAAR